MLALEPRVLAIGETHAQRGLEGIPSTTRRFTEELLPVLGGRASDVVVEIWVADGSCGKQEKQVAQQQRDVTVTQAPTNQNEFVTLGHAARRHGIVPHVLRPSCEEYARIVDAGAGDVATMLEMIARLTAEKVRRLLTQPRAAATTGGAPGDAGAARADAGAARMVVAYGGAMHNDAAPRPGREAWSFGPALRAETGGRYVELDLIVPEYVKDTEAWRSLPWYPHFDRASHPGKTKLYRSGPESFVLVLPSAAAVDAGAPATP
ncbi:MAG: hypothetical protein IT376_07020 [Polyangiaceae bacterium]|nr:hypothetical protein [Polyangiaceae bacterium]